MSVPQSNKQSSHQVVRMVYDKQSMERFFTFSVIISIFMIFMMFYTLSVIKGQSDQIRQLSKMVNELSFKIDEESISKLQTKNDGYNNEENKKTNNVDSQEIQDVLQLHQRYLKNIYLNVIKMDNEIINNLGEIKLLLQEQKASSWEIKEIIQSLKKKTQTIVKIFQGIDFTALLDKLEYLKPNFGKMGDKIKGTFNDIKDNVKNIFSSEEQTNNEQFQVSTKVFPTNEGFFSNIKNTINRKVKQWKGDEKQQM